MHFGEFVLAWCFDDEGEMRAVIRPDGVATRRFSSACWPSSVPLGTRHQSFSPGLPIQMPALSNE